MLRKIKGTVAAVAAVVGFAVWAELGPDTIMNDVSGTNTVREVVQAAGIGGAVDSVNGKTGTVELIAADVHALPDTYTPPAAPVQSVNGKTGRVVLGANDVGALPNNRDGLKANANFRNAVWDVQIKSSGGVDTNAVREIIRDEITPATNRLNQTLSDALDAHVENTNNPHSVTAGQVGAVPLVDDADSEKTAVTIGIRKNGPSVGKFSLANGLDVIANGIFSHAEGDGTRSDGLYSHAEGNGTTAEGGWSHAEGSETLASGSYSHAEGTGTTASGNWSHAEGYETFATVDHSHAEGVGTTASGVGSHAEGAYTTASGSWSHAEGDHTSAAADFSRAEGSGTVTLGIGSHADGLLARTLSGHDNAFAWSGEETAEGYYNSHGPGTYNINPVGGLRGFYIGEQTIYAILTNKADKADISADNKAFSNAVLAVGLNIDTNSVAVLNEIAKTFGGFPLGAGETVTTIGGLLAALSAAIAWLKKNKVGAFASVGGASATVDNGVAKLDEFFTESNTLLNSRITYERNATGLKDRAFNALTFDGTEYNLSTALAAVTPTASGQPRDLLIVATATAATTISFTAGTIKGDKPTIDGSGTWLITLTEYASGVWYCRQIKMEDAQ